MSQPQLYSNAQAPYNASNALPNRGTASSPPAPASSSNTFTPLSKDQLNLLQQPQANVTLFTNPMQPPSPNLNPTYGTGPATLQFHESTLHTAGPPPPNPPRVPSPLNLESEVRKFSAGDTLDEPIRATLLRDLGAIWKKLKRVCLPKGRTDVLRDWDLWGPLLLCLGLSIVMSISAAPEDTTNVFTGIFVIVWAGAGLVTLNTKLLGGTM